MAESLQDELSMACKCLNVRIRPQPQLGQPPDFLIASPSDPDYTLTYVGEHGPTIEHPQLTMRARTLTQLRTGGARCIRTTTLTCLVCYTLAYRVQQLVPLDVDGQEGSLLPSCDWVEQETLKSTHGWIEAYKDCLVSGAIADLSSSSAYSPVFHITTPQPCIPSVERAPENSPDQSQYVAQVGPFLSNLKPLFPPVPFVPSHPVFTHLSTVAMRQSEILRAEVERHIAAITQEKIAELQVAEDKLRGDVRCLWRQFIANVGRAERETGVAVGTKGQDGSRGHALNSAGLPGTPLVSVRDFIPVTSSAERVRSPTSSVPRVSSLSASLATSSLAVPREQSAGTIEPNVDVPRSLPSHSSYPASLGSVNGRLPSPGEEGSPGPSPFLARENTMQPFRRAMDETHDTAVSFRYFTIVEAEAARTRQQQPAGSKQVTGAEELGQKSGVPGEAGGDMGEAKTLGNNEVLTEVDDSSENQLTRPDRETTPRSKRRVTFDIKVETDAAKSTNHVKGSSGGASLDAEEMIFDLEDEGSDRASPNAAPVLRFVDNSHLRHGRQRSGSHAGRPVPFSSLWPTSLPPQGLRTRTDGEVNELSKYTNGDVLDPIAPISSPDEQEAEYPDGLDEQKEEILRLVAAHTPSHRNAWKRNSRAWKTFLSRQHVRDASGGLIAEENEDDSERTPNDTDESDWDVTHDGRWSGAAGFPSSLPITIGPLVRRREPLSLASYQPKPSLQARAGTLVSPLPSVDGRHISSASIRRASYAERDRTRRSDPGALDFATETEDEDEDEDESDSGQPNVADETRGRHRALKILEARSKIPAAGMWRSLA